MYSISVYVITLVFTASFGFTIGHFMPESVTELPYELDTIFVCGLCLVTTWWYLTRIEADIKAQLLNEETSIDE